MAQKFLGQLVDDLDGTTAEDIETVQFGLDGVTYFIDLSARNADDLRARLREFVANARRIGGRADQGTAIRASADETRKRADPGGP